MSVSSSARIIALGSYLPQRVLTNRDLENLVETSDEWIVTRTGMKERRIAGEGECSSDMGLYAAREALSRAGLTADQMGMIIVATMTPDYPTPSTANLIQAKLQAQDVAAMDIQAACTGFLYALATAKAYVESGLYPYVLVVAAEKMSAIVDYTDRTTCVLFGDGAAAAVVAREGPGLCIHHICLGSDGQQAQLAFIPAGGARQPTSLQTLEQRQHYFKMTGNAIFKHAVRRMGTAARQCLLQAGLNESQISWIVPHQANKRIIDAIAKQLDLPDERVYQTLHKYGNTSASSIAIALEELVREKPVASGEHLLLTAFGGGLTWGAAILTQTEG